MKKLKIGLMALALSFGAGNASAQVVEQGTVLIDVYYGFPDLFKTIMKAAYESSGETGLKIGGIGPLGGRFEYMVADKIGMGLEVNYTDAYVSYNEDSYDYITGLTTNYDYKISFPRLRAMATFNVHFGNSDAFDGYFKVRAGYKASSFKFETDDPDFNDADVASIGNLIPVAFGIAVGGRYYFTDALGMNFEIGLGGGPLLAVGLSTKF